MGKSKLVNMDRDFLSFIRNKFPDVKNPERSRMALRLLRKRDEDLSLLKVRLLKTFDEIGYVKRK